MKNDKVIPNREDGVEVLPESQINPDIGQKIPYKWGNHDHIFIEEVIQLIYERIVFWRKKPISTSLWFRWKRIY